MAFLLQKWVGSMSREKAYVVEKGGDSLLHLEHRLIVQLQLPYFCFSTSLSPGKAAAAAAPSLVRFSCPPTAYPQALINLFPPSSPPLQPTSDQNGPRRHGPVDT